MADVNSNININFNTAAALAQLRQLQAGLSRFHQSLAEGNLAAANAQKGLNAQLLQSIGATGKFSASQVKVAGSTLAFTSALEKNKLSLREYYRYTMAAATANTRVMGRAFAQEREIINRARRDRVKALQAQYIQMNKANSGFMDAIRIMPKSLAMANGKFTELGTRIQYAAQRQQFLNQLLKQGSTQLLNFGKNTQWAGRQLMVGLTMPLALFGGMAAKTFRELEKEIVKFQRVYGNSFTSDSETDAAIDNIKKLANEYTKYGVSVTKTVEMAANAAAAGFTGTALNAQVETATKLAVLGQIEQQQALETTISLQSAFGISSEELSKKIDFLNAVENQTLLSIEDLTIAIPKAAPVIKQLGGSVEDLAFFMTAMKEGGINASEGANALKSGLASLINPSDKASKMLKELGINVKGIVESNQGDIKATVIGFAQALDTLDPLNRARAIEQMFGKFQFSRLSTLFQNVTKDGTQASRALSLAGASIEELAILSEREMKKIEDSVGVKFQAAVEQFKQTIMPIGKVFLEALTPVVKFFGKLFEKFNGLSDQTKKVIAIIVGVVAGLGPVVLMTFGLLANGVANVIKLFALLRGGIARLNGQTNVMGAGFNYMTQEQIENAASSQQLHQTHTRLIEVFNVEKVSVNALAASYNSLSTQMRAMASANPSLFAGGMPGASSAVRKLPPVRKFKDGILSVPGPKGAGDIQPAMLSPGEAVIPTKTTEKYKGLITAMFQDKVPGFMAGRIPAGPAKYSTNDLIMQRVTRSTYPGTHPEKQSGAKFVGMPKSATEASQSRQILDRISSTVRSGRFGSVEPTNFGTLLQPFSGRSFPARGVGGIYRKPNGEIVVVKPTIDEKTALAEIRATQIAREVHGLVSPRQTIRTMMDPTDPTGQRKFIVIESPYDPRIAAATGKFTQSDMVKQLVASTLRGDRDLQKANLSGNVLSDVGTAGVFDRASGFRDFAKTMPSMEQQAIVNLLGVKGGAKKFFAQETSGIAADMTPAQYDAAIKAEISGSIPRLEKVIKSFDLNPEEQIVYGNMLQRLKNGAKTDWAALHPMHARAGSGVVKAIKGIDPNALTPEIREQLSRYSLASMTQEQSMIDELKRNAQTALLARLDDLDLSDPTRGSVVRAAWEGGKAPLPPSMKEKGFSAPRQSSFLNEISKMTPIDVDGVTKYVHDVDMDAFSKDPNGRAKYARTKEQVIDNLLYRMGASQGPNGYVAGGKFKGRFANPTEFLTDLRSTGLQSGSWKGNVKKQFRKPLSTAEKAYNAEYANQKYIKMMTDAGLTPEQAKAELKAELSHTSKTGAPGRGPEKWLRGTGSFDSSIVNRYMNSQARLKNLLDWNKKNGYSLIPQDGIDKYYQAAAFMSKGGHPTNAYQASLVALAADADLMALDDPRVPTSMKTDYSKEKLNGMRALLADKAGRGFYESATRYNLGAGSLKGLVLAQLGEYIYDKPKRTLEKITNKNSKKAGPTVKADTGNPKDNRVVTEGRGKSVVTKSQAGRIATGRGVRILPGREKGDPSATLSPLQKQELKRIAAKRPDLSESQLKDLLRRTLKHEQDIAKAKGKEAAAAKKAAKRAEMLPKQQLSEQRKQTQASRQRYLEQQRRMELNRQQALTYDAAVREDQKRTLKAQQAKRKVEIKDKRMARQQRIGGASGGLAMGLGMAGSAMMMSGNMGGGMAMMGASAVAGMAPMLMNPYVAAGTAVIAMGAGLLMLEKQSNKTAKAQSQLVDATSATTSKMQAVGEMNNKVGASQLSAEKRSRGMADRYTTGYERGKQPYGATFLESQVGKDVMSGFTKSMASGTDTAAQQMALQLAGYISDGVMSAEQAHSVASQIGISLNNQSLTAQISGQLLSLVGPGGKDLLNNPLEIRIRLVEEQKNVGTILKNELETSLSDTSFSTDTVLSETSKFFSPFRVASLVGRIPGVDMGFVEYSAMEMFTETKAEAQVAAGAASGVQSLEFSQAQIDSLDVQFDKEKKILESKKAATKDAVKRKQIEDQISALETRRLAGVSQLRQGNADILQQQINLFKVAQQRGAVENAFFDSLKEQVRLKAEETGQGDFVNAFLKSSAELDSKELEVKINTVVASGLMPVATATTLLSMFGDDEKSLDRFINVTTQLQDPGLVTQLVNSLGGIETETGKELLLKIGEAEPGEAEKILSTIARIQKAAGKEINFEAFMQSKDADEKSNVLAQIESLQKELEVVEGIEGPITREVIAKIDYDGDGEANDMQALLDRWHEWEGLDDEVKKTVIQEYITLLRTISPEQIQAYAQTTTVGMGNFGKEVLQYAKDNPDVYRAPASAFNASQAGKQLQLDKDAGLLGDDSDGKKADNPLAFIDSLAMGIKQVKDNAFNALKPIESMLAAFRDSKTQKGAFALFDGIQNRLLRFGAGEELRGAINSMSAEDFAKVAALPKNQSLFTFKKGKPKTKDTITGLTERGKAVDQTYKEQALGNLNFANEESIQGVKDQTKAYNILISSGVSASKALEIVSNKSYAAAIATGAIKKGTEKYDDFIKKIKISNTELERQAVLNNAIKSNEDFALAKQMPALVDSMKELGYSTDQIDSVLQNPELAKFLIDELKDGKLDATEIADQLNSIEAQKIIDIQVQLNRGNFAEAAEQGRQIIDELFAAEEGLIKTGIEANDIIKNDKLISDLEAQIDPFLKKIEAATEEVNDLNRTLEMNPLFGDRAIQAVQDENSRLSNDLTLISNAAEEVNKRYDEQAEALSKIQEINEGILEQQRGQLDLADALTSGDISAAARAVQAMRAASAARFASAQSDALQRARENELASLTARPGGQTREQIEKKQYDNSQRIYAMETNTDRVKIVEDIQKKQDEIYNIEEDSIEPRQKEIDDLVAKNEELQRIIDKKIQEIKVDKKTKDQYDTINAQLDYYAAAQAMINNPTALAAHTTALGALDTAWTGILEKMKTYKTNFPDAVKTQEGSIKAGTNQSSTDRARADKETADKAEADRKIELALRKLTVGATLTDEEKGLLSISTLKPSGSGAGRFAPQFKADGGFINSTKFANGAFAKGTDTVPAMLTPGEYVLRKSAVEKYGVDNLDAMNVGYYDLGGFVSSLRNNPLLKKLPQAAGSGGIYQIMEEFEKVLSLKHGSNQNSSGFAKWSRALGRVAFNTLQHALSGVTFGLGGALAGVGTGLVDGISALVREGSAYGLKGGKYADPKGSKKRIFNPKEELESMSFKKSAGLVAESAGLGALFGVGGNTVSVGFKKLIPNILQSNLMNKVSSKLPKINSFTLPKLVADIKARKGIEPSGWEKAYAIASQQADVGGFTPIESLLSAKHSTLLRELEALKPKTGYFYAPKSGTEYKYQFTPGKASTFPQESSLLSSIRSYAEAPNAYTEKLGPEHLIMVTEVGSGKKVASLTWDSVTGSIGGAYTDLPFQDQGIMRWLNEYASSFSRLKHSKMRTPEGKAYSAAVGGIMPDKQIIDQPLPINLAIIEALKTSGLDSIFENSLRPRVAATPPRSTEQIARDAFNRSGILTPTQAAERVADAAARNKALDVRMAAWRDDVNRTYNSYPYFEEGHAYIAPEDLAELTRLKVNPDTPKRGGDRFTTFKAKGGIIPEKFISGGYSSGTDTVPAMLTPGEYVLRKDAVKKYGVENLDAMNLGYYDKGGPVGHRHERNAPATPERPRFTLDEIYRQNPGGGMKNPSYTPSIKESNSSYSNPSSAVGMGLTQGFTAPWLEFFGIKGLQQTANKLFQGGKNKALNNFYSSKPNNWDYLSAGLFPLNFLASGEKAAAQLAVAGGKQTPKMLSLFSKIKGPISKVTTPFKELFLPAANPNFNIKNSFLEGLQRGKPRMGFAKDPAAIKTIKEKMNPLVEKLNASDYVQVSEGGEFMLRGTHTIPYSSKNAIEQGHPLYETVLAISKLETELMGKSTRSAKNFGYYASVAGSFVKKIKDKIQEILPARRLPLPILPGQISEKALQIGTRLDASGSDGVLTGINNTFRATLDGVPGFYKNGLDFEEVQREIFGSIFAKASGLIAPQNIPVVLRGKEKVASGIFSPDVAAQGAQTLRALKTLAGDAASPFDRVSDVATATQTGYKSAIQTAMRFVDDHDGNTLLNPKTGVPGLIDFGRILDFSPFVPTVDGLTKELLRPFYTYGVPGKFSVMPDTWKNSEITKGFFSGVDKGLEFLKTLKEKDIVAMLKSAGYSGEQLKKQTELVMESIRVSGLAAVRAADDTKIKQVAVGNPAAAAAAVAAKWDEYSSKWGPTIPGNIVTGTKKLFSNANAQGVTDWMRGLANNKPDNTTLKTPINPLKPLALGLLGGSTGLAGLLLADPDLSSVKITRQPPKTPYSEKDSLNQRMPRRGGGGNMLALSRGGIVPNYFAAGGYAIGTDTVPAMLTPGEFVMSKYAVDTYGVDNMKAMNSGSSVGDSVYNYNLNLNVKSDANPDDIARAVMVQIKSVDAQRIRGARF